MKMTMVNSGLKGLNDNTMSILLSLATQSSVWRAVSSHSSHHPQEVLLAQFSLYVHKCGLKPHSFHFTGMQHLLIIMMIDLLCLLRVVYRYAGIPVYMIYNLKLRTGRVYGIRRSLNGLCSITEVKQRRARFIIGWVTAWDCQVLYTLVGLKEPRKSDGSSD